MDRRGGWHALGRLSGISAVSVAIALTGSVLWSGCSSEDDRFYCDSTGCYQCDGYGCKNVDPPGDAGTVDTGKADTGTGQDAGKPPPPVCKYPSDCPDGKSCVNGQCVSTCTGQTPGECGPGRVCIKNVCQPEPGKPQCDDDTDCRAPTPKCANGRCVAACTDGKCPAGQVCNANGACVPDNRPKPPICAPTDNPSRCASNQQCVDGFCKYSCQNDQTCRSIDARIPYCGQDKVCRTQAEAHPQCTTECPGEQLCIDNVCR